MARNYIYHFWQKKTSWASLLLLLLLEIGYSYTAILFTDWNKVFFDHLQQKDMPILSIYIWQFLQISFLSFCFFSLSSFLIEWIAMLWRERLIKDYTIAWLKSEHFLYPICHNTEQRIADDATNISKLALNLLRNIIRSCLLLIVFLPLLWNISEELHFFKGILVYVALFMAIFGSWLFQGIFGKKFDYLQQETEDKNAFLRAHLNYVGLHSEQIYFANGQQKEYDWLIGKLEQVLYYTKKMIFWQFWFSYLQNIFIKINAVLATFILTPFYLAGKISFGVLSQATTIFFYVSDAFSFLPRYTQEIALMSAAYARLKALQDSIMYHVKPLKLDSDFVCDAEQNEFFPHQQVANVSFLHRSLDLADQSGLMHATNASTASKDSAVFLPNCCDNTISHLTHIDDTAQKGNYNKHIALSTNSDNKDISPLHTNDVQDEKTSAYDDCISNKDNVQKTNILKDNSHQMSMSQRKMQSVSDVVSNNKNEQMIDLKEEKEHIQSKHDSEIADIESAALLPQKQYGVKNLVIYFPNSPHRNHDNSAQNRVEKSLSGKSALHSQTNSSISALSMVNMQFNPGSRILIKGDSGIGKTTFFKVLAGIWKHYDGEVYMPMKQQNASTEVFFSSTQPYMPLCSLYEAIVYPDSLAVNMQEECSVNTFIDQDSVNNSDSLFSSDLDSSRSFATNPSNLSHPTDSQHSIHTNPFNPFHSKCTQTTTENVYSSNHTSFASNSQAKRITQALSKAKLNIGTDFKINFLSSGQKQRLLFARLFYHQPQYIFLDEPTSSLNASAARDLISTLMQLLPQSCIVMITHQDFFDAQFDQIYNFKLQSDK